MIRSFKHKGLETFFLTGSSRGIKVEHVKKLRLILGLISQSKSLRDLSSVQALKFHALKGGLKGFYSVTVSANWRLIFRYVNSDFYDLNYIDYH